MHQMLNVECVSIDMNQKVENCSKRLDDSIKVIYPFIGPNHGYSIPFAVSLFNL